MPSKIPFSRDKLLDKAKARKAAIEVAHGRTYAKYEQRCNKIAKQVSTALTEAAAKAAEGNFDGLIERYGDSNTARVALPVTLPSRPALDTERIDKKIALLELIEDNEILITADEAAELASD